MKKIFCILVSLCLALQVRPASAIFPDFTPAFPVAPQISPLVIAPSITAAIATVKEGKSIVDKYSKMTDLKNITQSLKQYGMNMGKTMFNEQLAKRTSKKKVVSSARTIEECTIAGDVTDEAKVKDAFKTLFLQYPSQKNKIKKAYSDKGKQFQMDTTMEMYITAREMSKELKVMLAQLDNIEKCLVAGEDCSAEGMEEFNCQKEGAEDKVCLWRNSLTVVRIYDKIMRYNEFLTAMNNQLFAVRGIGTTAQIKEFVDKDEDEKSKKKKQSSLEDVYRQTTTKMVFSEVRDTMVFASATLDSRFEMNEDAGLKSPTESHKEDFKSMEKVNAAQKKLNEALSAHNYKQTLPSYKSIFEDYQSFKAYQDKVIENLNISTRCITNYLEGYYRNSSKSWMGDSCVRNVDSKYECHYAEPKSADDSASSIGEYDVFCADNPQEKCYIIGENKYEDRGGISGWLLSLSEEAKVTENINNEDIYVTGESAANDDALPSYDAMRKKADASYDKNSNGDTYLKKPSMEEDLYAEGRKNELMNWTLGAMAAKEVYSDIAGKSNNFGTASRAAPVWNDQKYFYDEYLNNKYQNIKAYLEVAPILGSVVDELEQQAKTFDFNWSITKKDGMLYAPADLKNLALSGLSSLKKLMAKQETEVSEVESFLQKEDEVLSGLTQEHQKSVDALTKQKAEYYQKMETISQKLESLQSAANEDNAQIDKANADIQASQEGLDEAKEFRRGTTISLMEKTMSTNIETSKNAKSQSLISKDGKDLQTTALKKEFNSYRAKIKEIDRQVVELNSAYILRYATQEEAFQKEFAEIAENAKTSKTLLEMEQLIEANPTLLVINGVVKLMRQYAIAEADEAVAKLETLKTGNQLYHPHNIDKITAIHQEFLQKLRAMSVDNLSASQSTVGNELSAIFAQNTGLQELLEPLKVGFSKLTEGKDTPDTQYFVALIPQNKDLQSPKEPVDFVAAPLREIFHFDLHDYGAVPKYTEGGIDNVPLSNKDVTLSKISLLSGGLEIPQIWSYILQRHAFVEKELDLEKLLNKTGNPAQTLMYSGMYPCQSNAGELAITIPAEGSAMAGYAKNSGATAVYPKQKCTGISISGGKYSSIIDNYSGYSVSLQNSSATSEFTSDSSELGQILEYYHEIKYSPLGNQPIEDNRKLTFRKELQYAAHIMVKNSEKIGSGDKPTAEEYQYYLYQNVLFTRNQFGDYLNNVELEKVTAQTMAELKVEIDELRKSLQELFEQLGYTISEDFDLSNEDDYKLAQEVLEKHKNNNMRAARDIIQTIQGNTDYITAQKETLQHGLQVLERDKDEVVVLSLDDDLDELEEKIKNGEADKAVIGVYDEKGKSSFKDQIKKLTPPYCGVYAF